MSEISSELRDAVISGARWTFSARFIRETVGFAASVILARLVSPEEFGHAAIAVIFVALTAILGSAGCTAPLIQREQLTSRLVGAAVMLCLAVAVVLTIVTAAAAEPVFGPLFGNRTAELILLASPAWLLVSLGAPSHALLQRSFRFRTIAIIEASAAILSATTAILLAQREAGGAAIVAGYVVLVGSSGLFALAAMPPRSWRTDRAALRDTVGFATPLASSSLVYVIYRNVDYLILGLRTTPAQVGYYWRAWQLGVSYQSKISDVMQWVSLPVFSRASHIDELRAIHHRIVRTHATVLLPLLAVFIGAAPVLVPWLFGSTWKPAVVPAQIMAIAGMAEAITTGIGPLMVAVGRPGVLLRLNLVVLAVFSAMIFVLAPHGINVVATGVAVSGVVLVIGTQAFIRRPYAGLTFRDLWAETRPGIVAGTGVLIASVLVREALESIGTPSPVLIAVLALACLLTYSILLKALFPAVWRDLRAIVRAVSRRVPVGSTQP